MSLCRRKIPYEIKDYESTMFFGLTTRQLICVVILVVLVVPTIILNKSLLHLSSDALGWVILVEAIPPAACGWLKYNNMPIEQIALKVFEFYFGDQKRKWQFWSKESQILDTMIEIELDELTKERNEELEAEKKRIKEELKEKQKNVKRKKDKGKGEECNA